MSVIIPIYNAEKFLGKCLDSVLNQTYEKYEVILVDDGSDDMSGVMCDRYADKNSRIRVIHKKNEGLICARISGIEMARGDWIAFVDADDWVEDIFLECLANVMESEGVDIVISGCIYEESENRIFEKNNIASGLYEKNNLVKDIYAKMLYYKDFFQFGILPYMWNKLFRKDLIKKCYENIDVEIYDGEDVTVVYPYLLLAERVMVISECLYHYRIHKESITANKGDGYYENVSKLYIYLNTTFKKSIYYNILLPQLNQYMRMMIWQSDPDSFIKSQQIFFPFCSVPCGSNIILYGAGRFGQTYFHQLQKTGYCKIIAWVDKNCYNIRGVECIIESPEVIAIKEFDYIVIAVFDKKIQEEICMDLSKYGLSREKMIFI